MGIMGYSSLWVMMQDLYHQPYIRAMGVWGSSSCGIFWACQRRLGVLQCRAFGLRALRLGAKGYSSRKTRRIKHVLGSIYGVSATGLALYPDLPSLCLVQVKLQRRT